MYCVQHILSIKLCDLSKNIIIYLTNQRLNMKKLLNRLVVNIIHTYDSSAHCRCVYMFTVITGLVLCYVRHTVLEIKTKIYHTY